MIDNKSKGQLNSNILIVDDEINILNSIKRLLRSKYDNCFFSSSAEEAMIIMNEKEIDVVISDMCMPCVSGSEFLVSAYKNHPFTIFIILTAYRDHSHIIDTINKVPIFRYISKPWDENEFLPIIHEAAYKSKLIKDNCHLQHFKEIDNDDLKSINIHLAKEIDEKNRKINETTQALIEAYRDENEMKMQANKAVLESHEKSRFLANMSHEIRTPLNAIINMNSLLLETSLDNKQKNLVSMAKHAGETLKSIINDILDLSKIESGHFSLNRNWFNFNATLEETIQLLSIQAEGKNINLIGYINYQVNGEYFGDIVRIKQILINVIGNAIKFTENGGVYISSSYEDGNLSICIEDTGIGLTEDQISRIFEDFVQIDSNNNRKYNGTGLGLSIVKKIVAEMKGLIHVESDLGQGTKFILSLPLANRHSDSLILTKKNTPEISCFVLLSDTRLSKMITNIMLELEVEIKIVNSINDIEQYMNDSVHDVLVIDMEIYDAIQQNIERVQALSNYKKIVISNRPNNFIDTGNFFLLSQMITANRISEILFNNKLENNKSGEYYPTSKEEISRKYSILVAEDSTANQIVVSGILSKYNCEIIFANNGEIALEYCKNISFDLILMDISMPIMDGYECARLIKNSINMNTSIIALTANAFEDDKKRCLDLGMDDFIAKPIDIPTFKKKVFDYLSKLPKDDSLYNKLIDSNQIDGLAREASWTTLHQILDIFYEETEKRVPIMISASNDNNWKLLQDEAHALKSSSGSFGASSLNQIAENIESNLKMGENHKAAHLIHSIESIMHQSIHQMRQYVEKSSSI